MFSNVCLPANIFAEVFAGSKDKSKAQTYLSSTLFLLLLILFIIIIIVFPFFNLWLFPQLCVALGVREQHCGWQRQCRWTGTGRHTGGDLGCDGGQQRSRRLGWRHHRPTVLGDGFVVIWKKPLLDWVVLDFRWLRCEWLRWVGQGASGRDVRREAEGRNGGSRDVSAEA